MKNFNLYAMALAGCLALTSCSSDDNGGDGNNNGNVSSDLVGTYQLTDMTAPSQQDYDNDGDRSTNFVLEGSCYNDSWISFHDDGTYDESFSRTTTGQGGLTLDCDTQISSGTYEENGNNITTHRTSGSGSLTMNFTFDSNAKTISRSDDQGQYSSWNSASSIWANLTGNLHLTFTKYTDNDNDEGANADTDGPNNDENNSNFDLLGNFGLTSYLVGNAQDLDHDGDSSTNLMSELSCYSESKIKLHEDGTYEETRSNSFLSNLGLNLNCNNEIQTGRWTRNGNNVHTTSYSSSGSVSTDYTMDSNHHLTRNESNGSYPSYNVIGSLFTMVNGAVSYQYTQNSSNSGN